jgi:tripartite-type tricarboxylate transporter receptor subunit TctC
MLRILPQLVVAAATLAGANLMSGSAAAFPDRLIKIVVPSPAGGPPDQIARLLSDKMGAVLGQPVIVENRTGGAGGIIGAKSVATSEPDGHTLFMGSTSSVLIAPLLYKNAGYTAATFAPVARVAESTEMLAVHPSVPANTVAELVKLAKEKPGALSYGSAGVGTLPHLEGEFLKTAAGIQMVHVPYRGGGQALTGLLAGEVQLIFSTLVQILPHVLEGRLKGLAVSSAERSALAPEVPTLVESGYPQFITTSVSLIVAPPGTPLAVRQKLNAAVEAALNAPEVKQVFAALGAEGKIASPDEVSAYLADAEKRWSKFISEAKLSID